MKPEEIIERAKNPNNIPGIYNYCDRWCERCTFTSRCLNRELGFEREKNLENLDRNNEKYWEELGVIFGDTLKLIEHVAKINGIDLSNISGEEELASEIRTDENFYENARQHIISIEAKKYVKMTDSFLEGSKEFLDIKQNDMNLHLSLEINSEKIKSEADDLNDILETISWYNNQIEVKLIRALSGKFDEENEEMENDFPKDSDGSAKVALIGIDRSISAWGKLYELIPEKSNEIISMLLQLDKLRIRVESEFPYSRSFKRPGFDEIH